MFCKLLTIYWSMSRFHWVSLPVYEFRITTQLLNDESKFRVQTQEKSGAGNAPVVNTEQDPHLHDHWSMFTRAVHLHRSRIWMMCCASGTAWHSCSEGECMQASGFSCCTHGREHLEGQAPRSAHKHGRAKGLIEEKGLRFCFMHNTADMNPSL